MAETTKSRSKAPPAEDVLEMDDRYHAEGCPVLAGESDRPSPIEETLATRKRDNAPLRLLRCVECGGQAVEVLEP